MREVLMKRGVVHQTKSVACGVRSASRCWVVNIAVYYSSPLFVGSFCFFVREKWKIQKKETKEKIR